MIILIDTDVLIDLALDRKPHAQYSESIINSVEEKSLNAFIAWHTVSNFYYMVAGTSGDRKARLFIKELLQFVNISETSTNDVLTAIDLPLGDFEDALQVAAASACSARFIITRNVKHYKKSNIPALTPKKFIELR
jgi:predicted nucleic acid-binding protein